MKKNVFQRVVCMLLSVTLLFGAVSVTSFAAGGKLKPNSTAATLDEMQALVGTVSYREYINSYANSTKGENPVEIEVDLLGGSGAVEKVSESSDCLTADWENFYTDENPDGSLTKNEDNAVFLPVIDSEGNPGKATWTIEVTKEQQGFYYLYIEYYNCKVTNPNSSSKSSVSSIQKKFFIDGKVPFSEVGTLIFDKHWSYTNYTKGEETPAPAGTTEPSSNVRYEEKDDGYFKYVDMVYSTESGFMQRTDTYKMAQDINGNSMTPPVEESSEWNTFICRDSSGYEDGYFKFFLPYGTRTITLESEREPVVIKSIKFVPAEAENAESQIESLKYEDYLQNKINSGAVRVNGSAIRLEAEFPDYVSDSSVLPGNSNDSAVTYPIKAGAQMFNVIGKTSYDAVGQWAAYKFTVNETGLYKINMRFKQSALEGMFICRTLKLVGGEYGLSDGTATVPFAEADQIRFDYNKDWQSDFIGDGNHDYFEFYFEEGVEYVMYLECSLGDLSTYIKAVEDALNSLNDAYLKILQRTGASPDVNATYDFHRTMPEVLVTLLDAADVISGVSSELEQICGTKGSHLATLDTIVRVLQEMGADDGIQIAANLSTLKTHLGTLGTWVNDSKKGTLILDSINILPSNNDDEDAVPKAKAGFFKSIGFEISSFIHSFFTDYNQMGLTEIPDENATTVEVWLATGRDQSQIWRTMIDSDEGYTDTYGHAVALKLVTAGTLLPSILAGRGPDVYLGLGASDVINYAIRDAILAVDGTAGMNGSAQYENGEEDAKKFTTNYYINASGEIKGFTDAEIFKRDMDSEGWTLVSASFNNMVADLEHSTAESLGAVNDINTSYNFAPAAMNSLALLDQTFGIPQTMTFAMMFYRMDVLAELNKEVPESWEELLDILPDLQMNNMTIGVSYVAALDFMMYQQGGNMWKFVGDEYDSKYAGAKIDLDSKIALDAFEFVCNLYTLHSLPVAFDASNRFRTGEMPLVIGDYISTYNTLAVFATEIGGLWEFSSLPGSENPDEADGFNYDSLATVTATVIPTGCDNIEAAWSFVQWQTGAYAQATYGNRIVAVVGPAAKYETANLNSIEDLSWTASEKAAIRDQMKNLNAIVNYPGSYIIARYMKFAFLDAYNDGVDATEAMMSYIEAINGEIKRKREEFELPIIEESDDEALKTSQ